MAAEPASQDRGTAIAIRGLRKQFGSVVAIDNLDLEIRAGEFLALLGPSGSGKSTVLMAIAGFETPSGGQILIDGQDCTRLPPNRRNIGMVFQNYTLFPHMSVLDNVAFPLKMRGVATAERRRRAAAALETVRLGSFGARLPRQLSGGQQQRVAIARAIVYNPRVLLMDEPLSALDKNLREEMQLEIKRLHEELGITVVFVTHDQGEALTMADRIAILKRGRMQQLSPARALYERPANLFAASFIGEMNQVPVRWNGREAELPGGGRLVVPPSAQVAPVAPGPAVLAVRPERVTPTLAGEGALAGTVRDIVYSGAGTLIISALDQGGEFRARVPSAAPLQVAAGARVGFAVPPEALLLYAEDPA